MSQELEALEACLKSLADKLRETPRNTPGYRAMRDLYRDLHIELLAVWEKSDEEIAVRIAEVSKGVREEWEEGQSIAAFAEQAKSIARSVGVVLSLFGIPNPLAFLD